MNFNPVKSKTVWGAVALVCATVAQRLQTSPPQTPTQWVALIMEAAGILMAAIGVRDAIGKIGGE